MNYDTPLHEALDDPEALPTVTECLNTIYMTVQDMHNELGIDKNQPMELDTDTARNHLRDQINTLINALDDVEQWGNEIITYAEKTM